MKLKRFITGPIQVNTYIVFDENTKEGIVIDVGGSTKEIADFIKSENLKIKGIYNTHGHFDHVMGAKELQDELKLDFYINKQDEFFVNHLTEQLALYGLEQALPPNITGNVDESTKLSIGNTKVTVITTPGHTQGGVCYLIGDMLFSGDTLFYESIGRTDLPGGNYSELRNSIREKLFTLDEDIKVFPGHDCDTSIAHEKINNIMV